MKFSLDRDLDNVLAEVKEIVYENKMCKGMKITINIRCDSYPTIDFEVDERKPKYWGVTNG